MLLDAKKRLFSNRPLNKNEYYSNFTSTISQKFILGVAVIHKVTVSAEVLKSGESNDSTNVFKNATAEINNKTFGKIFSVIISDKTYFISDKDTFKVGDEVYYNYDNDNLKNLKRYKVMSILKDKASLKSNNLGEESELVPIKHKFYSATKNLEKFKIGDKVKFEYSSNSGSRFIDGIIIATSNGYAIIQTISGAYSAPPIKLELIK